MTPDGEFTEREVGAALQELKEVRHDIETFGRL